MTNIYYFYEIRRVSSTVSNSTCESHVIAGMGDISGGDIEEVGFESRRGINIGNFANKGYQRAREPLECIGTAVVKV